MAEDADFNIYDDLEDFDLGTKVKTLEEDNAELWDKIKALETEIVNLKSENDTVKLSYLKANENISRLFKTCKLEICRKDRTIVEMRNQIERLPANRHHERRSKASPSTSIMSNISKQESNVNCAKTSISNRYFNSSIATTLKSHGVILSEVSETQVSSQKRILDHEVNKDNKRMKYDTVNNEERQHTTDDILLSVPLPETNENKKTSNDKNPTDNILQNKITNENVNSKYVQKNGKKNNLDKDRNTSDSKYTDKCKSSTRESNDYKDKHSYRKPSTRWDNKADSKYDSKRNASERDKGDKCNAKRDARDDPRYNTKRDSSSGSRNKNDGTRQGNSGTSRSRRSLSPKQENKVKPDKQEDLPSKFDKKIVSSETYVNNLPLKDVNSTNNTNIKHSCKQPDNKITNNNMGTKETETLIPESSLEDYFKPPETSSGNKIKSSKTENDCVKVGPNSINAIAHIEPTQKQITDVREKDIAVVLKMLNCSDDSISNQSPPQKILDDSQGKEVCNINMECKALAPENVLANDITKELVSTETMHTTEILIPSVIAEKNAVIVNGKETNTSSEIHTPAEKVSCDSFGLSNKNQFVDSDITDASASTNVSQDTSIGSCQLNSQSDSNNVFVMKVIRRKKKKKSKPL